MKMVSARTKYNETAVKALREKFGYRNAMAVPRILKVVVNTGIGKYSKEGERIDEVVRTIQDITGQKPVRTLSRKAIAGFKMREGQEVGVKVTLRRDRMWDFIDKLINVALPRTRDFQGINPKAIDGHGNLSIGIREQIIFPEVVSEKVKNMFSLQVNIIANAKSEAEGREMYKLLGFPIK